MAQRTIHYLFGQLLLERVPIRDKERFLLGSLLPDAYARREDRDTTHFITGFQPPERVCFDFGRFRQRFGRLVEEDGLYLGYYMHLAEDCFYRKFNYDRQIRMPANQAEVALLHRDYHILNAHIVRRYGLHNALTRAIDLEREPLARIAPFRQEGFLEELAEDFREDTAGQTHFITPELMDAFIAQTLPMAQRELETVLAGGTWLRAADFATERMV